MDKMEDPAHVINTNRIENYKSNEKFVGILLCIICLNLPLHPLQCKGCEAIVCKECYRKWKKPSQCPQNCSEPNYKEPSKTINKFFSEVEVSCRYRDNGCTGVISFSSLQEHEKNCLFQTVQCPEYPKCKAKILLQEISSHIKSCKFLNSQCEYCKEIFPKENLKNHVETTCPSFPLACKHCSTVFARIAHKTHEENCEERDIPCTECTKPMKRGIIDSHSCTKYLLALNEELKDENNQLKQRILSLEQEVGTLKNPNNKARENPAEVETKGNKKNFAFDTEERKIVPNNKAQNMPKAKAITLECCGEHFDTVEMRQMLDLINEGKPLYYVKDNELHTPLCCFCNGELTTFDLLVLYPSQNLENLKRAKKLCENELNLVINACEVCKYTCNTKDGKLISLHCGHSHHIKCIPNGLTIYSLPSYEQQFNKGTLRCKRIECNKKINQGDFEKIKNTFEDKVKLEEEAKVNEKKKQEIKEMEMKEKRIRENEIKEKVLKEKYMKEEEMKKKKKKGFLWF